MKKFIQLAAAIAIILLLTSDTNAQVSVPANAGGAADYVGWDATNLFPLPIRHLATGQPIDFYTGGTLPAFHRMRINGSGIGATSGYVGIATAFPQMPLHVFGSGTANSALWRNGLLLSNQSVLMWQGAPPTANNFFMAFASSTPVGDFWEGVSAGIGPAAAVNYSRHVFVTTLPPGVPQSSTQILKNLYVQEAGFVRRVGINNLNPINIVQITSNVAPGTLALNCPAPATTRSGLRFANLNATMAMDGTANSTGTVLSVNDCGDVIMVQGGGGFGGPCTSPLPSLAVNSGINLSGFNFVFAAGAGAIGISSGAVCFTPAAKLHIVNSSHNFGIVAGTNFAGAGNIGIRSICANGSVTNVGVEGRVSVAPVLTVNTGLLGLANVPGALTNIGVRGVATAANNPTGSPVSENKAGFFSATGTTPNTDCYGVHGQGIGSGKDNYGGRFEASGGGSANYGIWATAPIGLSNYAGFFEGDVFVNNPSVGTSGNVLTTSDMMFKTNLDSINNALGIINQLLPKTFFFDTTNAYNMRFTSKKQYGLIAQEVQNVLPELVSEQTKPAQYDTLGNMLYPLVTFKTLNYNGLFGIMLKAIQEQQAQINSLLSARTGSTNLNPQEETITEKIKLTLPEAPLLGDARPNPNSGYAEIPYFLPETETNATIIFTDMLGRVMKEKILATGYGTLGIDTQDLPNGTYFYTLIVNGKTIATKQMIRTK